MNTGYPRPLGAGRRLRAPGRTGRRGRTAGRPRTRPRWRPASGSAMSAAKRGNESPLAANASRLVRLETGSSSEAEFARCGEAYTCGRARSPTRAAVANTTGVSSTTVASRLSTAVISAATANTPAEQPARAAPGRPGRRTSPAAVNSPSSAHSCASTSTAARNPTTGSSVLVCAQASDGRHRADRHQQPGRRHRRRRLRPAPRPGDRERQHADQQGGGDDLGGDRVQGGAFPSGGCDRWRPVQSLPLILLPPARTLGIQGDCLAGAGGSRDRVLNGCAFSVADVSVFRWGRYTTRSAHNDVLSDSACCAW